ncbi:DUF2939 domain-containing protein [Neokomagataea thailandica]|uniref:DUF2939 domain-containing protein n=1 Tax=Neokomagataea tanensis NBRC 106556 TaxID=1223519 RepID=A0ABQ0QJY6_9PROT|nr:MULTISPECIES: DUF2939 domain-containing protein [Neokomagataea]GBR47449.1 hypothetical protein AA106556_1455 [Neokomagataea tanensis NBRC 106556]
MSVAFAPFFANKRMSVKRMWSFKKHIFATLIIILAAYVISPFIALWELKEAVREHDAQRLERHIDWSALSLSLREAINAQQSQGEDDLPDFGHSFAMAASAHVMETSLTPAVFFALIEHSMPFAQAGHDPQTHFSWGMFSVRFVGFRHCDVRIKSDMQTFYTLQMTFEHWGWRLTGIHLPQIMRQA